MALFPTIDASADWGQIFTQACLYGYVLSIGADMIGDGADLLMKCPKIAPLVGSIVVPILGAVPDGMMVLCSGLGDDAQEQINVGVGALAGSTVMLLTLPWFLSLISGRVTIKDGQLNYKAPAQEKLAVIEGGCMKQLLGALFYSGVGVHDQVKVNAKIMIMTTLPFLVIQVPAFMVDNPDSSNDEQRQFEKPFAVVGCVMCIAFFSFYMWKMFKDANDEDSIVQKQIVQATVEGIQNGHMTLRGAMHDFREEAMAELEGSDLQEPFMKVEKVEKEKKSRAEETVKHMCKVLEPFFKTYDEDSDNQISIHEFKHLLRDLRENVSEEKTRRIFDAADMDKSGGINFEEFVACIMAFALDPSHNNGDDDDKGPTAADGDDDDGDGEEEEDMPPDLADLSPAEQQLAIKKRACSKMFFGTIVVCLFSDPMCDLLGTMGAKADIPAFYISFLIAPLASNASELVSAMKLASKKTQSSMKESLSTLCGAAIMNNTFCLSIFFACFIVKNLMWKFSAETISIVFIQYIMGVIAITKRVQTVSDGCLIVCLYPSAMGIVWALKKFAGMD